MTKQNPNLDRAARGEGPIAKADIAIVDAAEPFAESLPVRAIGKASELADQPPLIAACVATTLGGLAARNSQLLRTGLRMLASHALATGIKTLLKDHVDRSRPDKVERDGEHVMEEGESEDGEDRSFPSGHSAGAVAVARAVAREYPASAPLGYTAAGLAAAVQVPRKAHFPSDVLVGVAIGLVSEAVVAGAARLVRRR